MIFRQLQDAESSTYSYLLADSESHEAVLIDPVFSQAQRDTALIKELGLNLRYTIDTHVHADHVTAAWLLKQIHGCTIAISAAAGADCADVLLEPGATVRFGGRWLEARATPGHTNGCMSFVLDDQSMVFTGDALLIRGSGRTDFQQGSAARLYESVVSQIFSLPDSCLVYPAHDYRGLTVSSVGEEKKYNPRLGGQRSLNDFEGIMSHLGLAHPGLIEQAVPANQACGRIPAAERALDCDWAPLVRTYAGIDEVDAEWVAGNAGEALILDVREPEEYSGPMGHIADARLVPLGELGSTIESLDRDRPIVTVCHAGGRSAQAWVLLKRQGFNQVANLAGGMLNWHAQGLPVEH